MRAPARRAGRDRCGRNARDRPRAARPRARLSAAPIRPAWWRAAVEIGLRAQAVRAGKGVDAEIADEQRGEGVKAERGEDSAAAVVGDHAVILPTRVKAD